MIGDDSFKNMNRQNNLDALHYCLRTDKHLSRTRGKEIKNMLREAECATESDPTRLSSLDRVTAASQQLDSFEEGLGLCRGALGLHGWHTHTAVVSFVT
jgi:hypothetical protein